MAEYRAPRPGKRPVVRVEPETYLTPLQAERAATQPDMLLEIAHIIADDFSARGYPRVQVYRRCIRINEWPRATEVAGSICGPGINRAWLGPEGMGVGGPKRPRARTPRQ